MQLLEAIRAAETLLDVMILHRQHELEMRTSESYQFVLVCKIETLALSLCFKGVRAADTRYWDELKYSCMARCKYFADAIPSIASYWRLGLRVGISAWHKDTKKRAVRARDVLSAMQDISACSISRIVASDEELDISRSKDVSKKIQILNSVTKTMRSDYETLCNSIHDQLISTGELEIYSQHQSPFTTISSIFDDLIHATESQRRLISIHSKPSFLVRGWISIILSASALFFTSKIVFKYSSSFFAYVLESYQTARDLTQIWLIGPLYEIYRTIRHKETRLALLGTASLQSDVESLERMVLDFATDQGVIDALDLELISNQVQNGKLFSSTITN